MLAWFESHPGGPIHHTPFISVATGRAYLGSDRCCIERYVDGVALACRRGCRRLRNAVRRGAEDRHGIVPGLRRRDLPRWGPPRGRDDLRKRRRALRCRRANREAVWAWTELYRVVDGCKSAFILYDATYDIPSIGYHQRTLTGVTYTHDGNRWLSIADQGTYLEAP